MLSWVVFNQAQGKVYILPHMKLRPKIPVERTMQQLSCKESSFFFLEFVRIGTTYNGNKVITPEKSKEAPTPQQ
jgi:hypothetical protein